MTASYRSGVILLTPHVPKVDVERVMLDLEEWLTEADANPYVPDYGGDARLPVKVENVRVVLKALQQQRDTIRELEESP